jgi:molybdopterin molybdotransferase
MPDAHTSAMDGYALSTHDLAEDGPFSLPLSGESRAGKPLLRLSPGTACRIFTGAVLPENADAVLLQEDARVDGATLHFLERTSPGDNVRRRGSEVEAGARVLAKGERLTPFGLGLLASVDCGLPRVFVRPRVSILCTGDELRDVGAAHQLGTIAESSGIALAAMAGQAGAAAHVLPRVGDDRAATSRAIDAALDGADLVLTVGGASVGDHDVVQSALERAGASIEFWKVRIKPGKPLMFGARGDCLVLGLPGNPVSAQVTFGLFGLPLLRAMQGVAQPLPTSYRGVLAAPLHQKPGRMNFHRATLQDGLLTPQQNQSSGSTASLASADALVVVGPDSDGHPAGVELPYFRLDAL